MKICQCLSFLSFSFFWVRFFFKETPWPQPMFKSSELHVDRGWDRVGEGCIRYRFVRLIDLGQNGWKFGNDYLESGGKR